MLPFANLSGDADNDYFSDGLADEIRDRIAQVPGLRVAARSSSSAFRGRALDARDIGRQLDVGLLLEGGVRRQRDLLRVSAQLVDARRGYQLWSQSFDRRLEDVFAVQSEIAHAILDAVHIKVLDAAVADDRPANFEAYNLYLLGRYHFHKRTEASLMLGVRYFRRAIEADPAYAHAYSGLADATSLLATSFYGNMSAADSLAEALPAAQRALELAPDAAEAQASIGLLRHVQGESAGAVAALERAIELNSNYVLAYVWLALVLQAQGHYREAERRNAEALRLDPLSPIVNANAGFDALRFGRYDDAQSRFQRVLELDPTFPVGYSGLARLHLARGQLDEAMAWQEQAIRHAPTVAYYLARKGYVLLQAGCADAASYWFEAARKSSLDRQYLADIRVGIAVATADAAALGAILADEEAFGEAQRALAALMLGDAGHASELYDVYCPATADVLREIVNYDRLWQLPHGHYRALAAMRLGRAGGTAMLDGFLEAASELRDEGVVNADLHYWTATAYALLDRRRDALAELEKAVSLGWLGTWWARRDPCLDSLREDGRCDAILAAVDDRVRTSGAKARGSACSASG